MIYLMIYCHRGLGVLQLKVLNHQQQVQVQGNKMVLLIQNLDSMYNNNSNFRIISYNNKATKTWLPIH